jgi:putative copper export protein
MEDLISNIGFLLSRYLHVVCATLLVGGTLFYEMVVPIAIDDLKPEQQLAVFARARWVFRSIVWTCVAVLLATGIVGSVRNWDAYSQDSQIMVNPPGTEPRIQTAAPVQRPGWWWAAHVSTGSIALLIALFLTFGNTPPPRPVMWMRLNLVILMVVIFLASAAQYVRRESNEREVTNMRTLRSVVPPSQPNPPMQPAPTTLP